MTTELIIPKELWQSRDELVDYALDGGSVPTGFEKIKEWFTKSEEAYLQLDAGYSENAIGNTYLTPWCSLPEACDQYLVDHYALDDGAEITDEQRIEFTRHLLSQIIEQGNLFYECAGATTIKSSAGRTCLIGYLGELHGQCGLHFEWQGVFPSDKSWDDYLEDIGYYDIGGQDGIDRLPDEAVLKIYSNNNGF